MATSKTVLASDVTEATQKQRMNGRIKIRFMNLPRKKYRQRKHQSRPQTGV